MPNWLGDLERWRGGLSTAWRDKLEGVAPDWAAVDPTTSLGRRVRLAPDPRRVFHALEGIYPADVAVVVIGNNPYPDPVRATGRSFEQGDLTDWRDDLAEPGRVTPSLLSLICAAAALHPRAAGLGLDQGGLLRRRQELRRGLQRGQVALLPPNVLFESLTGQGVLWLNRTPTTSVCDAGSHRRGSSWREAKEHRRAHRALWAPVTRAILTALTEQARHRRIVFALFGREAKGLRTRLTARRKALGVPSDNLRFVESGHPSRPRLFFANGNPLGRINQELTLGGCEPIEWRGAGTGPTTESTSLSATCQHANDGAGAPTPTFDRLAASAAARSIAIMERAVGKYRATLRQLAER